MPDKLLSENRQFRCDVAVLRVICIAIVVFFHGYGMTFQCFSDDISKMFHDKYYALFSSGPINLAMAMFTFISGFLFGGKLTRTSKPIRFKSVVKSKCRRLLLPYFIFTLLYMLGGRFFNIEPFWKWGFWHLWYLPMLFWCFIVTFLLKPLLLNDKVWISILTLIVLFAVSLGGDIVPEILGLQKVHLWYSWFALGIWFYNYEHILADKTTKIALGPVGGGIYVWLSIFYPFHYGQVAISGIVACLFGIAGLWSSANLINWRNNSATHFLLSVSTTSFGIYILHYEMEIYIVSSTAKRLLGIEQFAMEHTVLFPILFCSVAFALSYLLSALLLKTRIGRLLIG